MNISEPESDTTLKTLATEQHQLPAKKKAFDEVLKSPEDKNFQKKKMKLMHDYNEVKDAAQIILGAIANIEGVTVRELHDRYQLPLGD